MLDHNTDTLRRILAQLILGCATRLRAEIEYRFRHLLNHILPAAPDNFGNCVGCEPQRIRSARNRLASCIKSCEGARHFKGPTQSTKNWYIK